MKLGYKERKRFMALAKENIETRTILKIRVCVYLNMFRWSKKYLGEMGWRLAGKEEEVMKMRSLKK